MNLGGSHKGWIDSAKHGKRTGIETQENDFDKLMKNGCEGEE